MPTILKIYIKNLIWYGMLTFVSSGGGGGPGSSSFGGGGGGLPFGESGGGSGGPVRPGDCVIIEPLL